MFTLNDIPKDFFIEKIPDENHYNLSKNNSFYLTIQLIDNKLAFRKLKLNKDEFYYGFLPIESVNDLEKYHYDILNTLLKQGIKNIDCVNPLFNFRNRTIFAINSFLIHTLKFEYIDGVFVRKQICIKIKNIKDSDIEIQMLNGDNLLVIDKIFSFNDAKRLITTVLKTYLIENIVFLGDMLKAVNKFPIYYPIDEKTLDCFMCNSSSDIQRINYRTYLVEEYNKMINMF